MLSAGPSYSPSRRSSDEQDNGLGQLQGQPSGRSRPTRASELSDQELTRISAESEAEESSSSANSDCRPTVVPSAGRTDGQPDDEQPDDRTDRALLGEMVDAWDGVGG